MPRKRASGSSPEKPAVTPARRNTRRGRNKSEEPEVAEVPVEIPKHLLRGSDESGSDESDNDSDYGSPKKGGRGRVAKPAGKARKVKEPAAEATPTARPRRGRRAAVAKDPSPGHIAEEPENSQSTQETTEASESTQPEVEPEADIAPQENADDSVQEQVQAETAKTTVTHDNIAAAEDDDEGKVSEVIQIQSNNDQPPVNEEEKDGSKDKDDDVEAEATHCRESVVEESKMKVDSPVKAPEVEEEESKDAPESSVAQSDSRSNSSTPKRQRQRSSSGEIQEEKMEVDSSLEVKEKSPPPAVAASPPKEVEKVEPEKPAVQRKRKWTAKKTDEQPVIAITTDSLKNIISDEVKAVPLSDVKLLNSSPEPEPEEKRARTKPTADDKDAKKKLLKERLRKQEEEEQRRNEMLVKAIDKPANGGASSNGTALLKDRKVSIIVDDPTAAAPSPPKNESSNILYITNLVRPFTVLQLKGLLARTGKIVENGFWIDKIKSKCYVKYETEDEAVETRHALHGVTWPSSNPKCLNVDFGKEEDMEKAVVSTMEEMPRIQITTENRDVKEEKEFGWSKDPYKNASVEDRSRSSRPVREWDVGKKDKEEFDREDRDRNRRKRSSERENRRDKELKKEERPEKRRSMSESPGRKVEGDAPPVRLLDDLFRKTKATPCLYWLPLSAEQIIEKEEQRQKNLAEHERRMEEIRKAREERMRERRRSNSRDRRRDKSRDRRRKSVSRDRRYNRR